MKLNDTDYHLDGSGRNILLTKTAIVKWRDHYRKIIAEKIADGDAEMAFYYKGKADLLNDLFEHIG